MDSREERLKGLRDSLGTQLTNAERIKQPDGLPTGLSALDQFLFWKGFPKGALTALTGEPGLGTTSLWVEAATRLTQQSRWVAWVGGESQLFPTTLWQKELDLSRLVTIQAPETEKKLLWLLQELMSSTLFDLIGCDLGRFELREHQLRKLDKYARSFNTALIFFTDRERLKRLSLFALVVNFRSHEIRIERALHRQTPHFIPRRISYASFTLHTRDRIGSGVGTSAPLPSPFLGLEPRPLLDPATAAERKQIASASSDKNSSSK